MFTVFVKGQQLNRKKRKVSSSHRHQLLDGEVLAEGGVAPVAPGLGVDGHAVLPLVLEQVSRLVAIGTRVVATVGADGAVAPAIVGHHRVSYRTVKE